MRLGLTATVAEASCCSLLVFLPGLVVAQGSSTGSIAVALRVVGCWPDSFPVVNGFGVSSALKEHLQFARSHLLLSLFSFNVRSKSGKIAVLMLLAVSLVLLLRGTLADRAVVVLGAIVGMRWHWMIERGTMLWQSDWPSLDEPSLTMLAR